MTKFSSESDALLANLEVKNKCDEEKSGNADEYQHREFVALQDRAWSFGQTRRHVATTATTMPSPRISVVAARHIEEPAMSRVTNEEPSKAGQHYVFCFIYAVVNVIIAVPGLFGYAAVIFNHPIYANHMNALSKLLISSSLVHQLGFLMFSSLPFAIGTVQDAGLIFLSNMANTIADTMIEDGHTESEILSTTLALLCSGTALLGLVLILMGKFKLADAVSYLPMPVVGGYLAYIGYFCILAGTALCISKPMMNLSDWYLLSDTSNLMLAIPGLITGLVLTLTTRLAKSAGTLPLVMVSIPALFYAMIFVSGTSLEEARGSGWVGETSSAVPLSELVRIIDFSQVRWDLIFEIIPTWFGMVFVVSFASCLDVAAISIDMGQPLDTNRELATVGICNFMSGITLGFTGSYIFSQTIFTYRTGIHDKCIGFMIMLVYIYIVASPVNILEIAPLFFLGSTLIFIGYDLMYEWLWEVRDQVFLSEYCIVWFTFISIHAVGIDFGIMIGIMTAICDQIFTTAQSTGVNRIEKRSRAVYTKDDAKIIHEKAYCSYAPKIVTLEVIGNLFFGSSLSMLNQIYEKVGLTVDDEEDSRTTLEGRDPISVPPRFVVLDLMGMTHLDASATRGCFLQFAKMATKKQIVVCVSGLSPKIEWMFRSHEVAFETEKEEELQKSKLLQTTKLTTGKRKLEQILIFTTAAEALEFCETLFLHDIHGDATKSYLSLSNRSEMHEDLAEKESKSHNISTILSNFLRATVKQADGLERLLDLRYHQEVKYSAGQIIFTTRSDSNSFYIVLSGCVANSTSSTFQIARKQQSVVSGAGKVDHMQRFGRASSDTIATLWQVGGVFGFNDFLLERKRMFQTIAVDDETKLAIFTRSGMETLLTQDPELYGLMQQVLLRASTLDLANCTCHDV